MLRLWLRVDDMLNRLTMYRLAYLSLLVVLVWAGLLSLLGQLPFAAWQLAVSVGLLWGAGKAANFALAKLFLARTNVESAAITAFILSLILLPPSSWRMVVTVVLAGVLAMASKYLLVWRAKHVFNPAAIALVILSLLGSGQAAWWVASPLMLPVVALAGLAIARKLRRLQMALMFGAVATATILGVGALHGSVSANLLWQIVASWPVVFLGTIMLTEPSTTPPTQLWRWVYAVVVGLVFGSQLQIGPVASTPQVALVLGNLLTLAVGSRGRVKLALKDKVYAARNTYEFVFTPTPKPTFTAGQYLEWTLPHHRPDSRGNRRYFTIASSPTEADLRLAITVTPERSSSFKAALQVLPVGGAMEAWQLAGEFVLPADSGEKLVFIAGGIGITPFRSMIKYLIDSGQRRDIVLLYTAAQPDSFAYRALLAEAEQTVGLRVVYLLPEFKEPPAGWTGRIGFVTPELLNEAVPGFRTRRYYLAGPPAMVRAYRRMLRKSGVPRRAIKTDFFPGY